MKPKKKLLSGSRLYLLLDKNSCKKRDAVNTLIQAGFAGIDIIQLRQEDGPDREFLADARKIKNLCRKKKIIFLVNNRLDIAQISGADGLHLGQSDLPLAEARKILGKSKIIGISCRSLKQAKEAESQGADYIAIGPVFPSLTKPGRTQIKPGLIKSIITRVKIPLFVIGGINYSNINKLISYGAKRFAVCRAVCRGKNIQKSARALRGVIYKA